MAAGLGFKDFTTGEVLTAADVDGYLMQGVWVFASAAARDAAVTSPQEGNFAYLKDTNVTTYYTGSAWANLDTTGMTNPMTTTGDTIYSSSGSTPARLGIGTTGQVLTVAGGVPSWATPAGGGAGLELIDTTTFTSSSAINVNNVFTSTYTNYRILLNSDSHSYTSTLNMRMRASGTDNSSSNYKWIYTYIQSSSSGVQTDQNNNATEWHVGTHPGDSPNSVIVMDIFYPQATAKTYIMPANAHLGDGSYVQLRSGVGGLTVTTSYDGFSILSPGGTMTGKVRTYGYKN